MSRPMVQPNHCRAIKTMIDDITKNINTTVLGRCTVPSEIYYTYVRAAAGMDKYDNIGSNKTNKWANFTLKKRVNSHMVQKWFVNIIEALFRPIVLYQFKNEIKKYKNEPWCIPRIITIHPHGLR